MKTGYTKKLVLCAMFTALIAIGAFFRIPIPLIPLTLQVLFVLLAGILLGPKWGPLSAAVYILMGLIGLPVFTQGGGIGYFLKPTFGFMIGFLPGAYLTGMTAKRSEKPGFWRLFAGCLAGVAVIYFFGTAYLYLLNRFYYGNTIALWPMILACDIQPLPGDILKSIIAAKVGARMLPMIEEGII